MIFYKLTMNLDPYISFTVAAIFALLAGVICLFIVAEPKLTSQDELEQKVEDDPLLMKVMPKRKTIKETIIFTFKVFI